MEKRQLRFASRGDAGLLVLELPAEFAHGEESIQTFALPILSRAGGILLAVPQNAIDENLLIAGMQPDADTLVGPNKLMEAPLLEEEEGGTIQTVKNACKFFLVDFNDEALNLLHEYDNVSDDVETILPFDDAFKYAIISVEGLVDKAREWAGNAGSRAAFYSAREDLSPVAKASAPKKPKKPTNAALMEMFEALQAQVSALAVSGLLGKEQPPATPVQEPLGGLMLATPRCQAWEMHYGLRHKEPLLQPLSWQLWWVLHLGLVHQLFGLLLKLFLVVW